jgi:hypothetical protein
MPEEYTPAYNEQYIVCSGTNTAQTGFKYVVTLTIDGTALPSQKFPPRPDNSLLYYNPQRIVEAYVLNDYQFDIDEFTPATDSIKTIIVSIDEEYGSPVSGFTGTSGDYTAWNGAYNAHDFASYTYSAGSLMKELTLAPVSPSTPSIPSSDTINFDTKYLMKSWLGGFGIFAGGAPGYKLNVVCYAGNNLIQDSLIENAFYTTTLPERYYVNANCSPYGLNLIETNHPANIISKLDPVDNVVPASTTRYLYKWFTNASNVNSIQHEVIINDLCSNFDLYIVHFLNRLGNYDTYSFNLVSMDESKKEAKEYRNNPMYLDTTNDLVYSNSKSDRQNYNTIITNKITLNSDWVNDTVYAWLKDLFMSPSIKLEDANGNLYAVTCVVKDWKSKKVVNDRLFNVTIELEYDYQDIRQRG